jgi:phosphatidylethanolamine-binding protein (PEBP) family uncharacterized protein
VGALVHLTASNGTAFDRAADPLATMTLPLLTVGFWGPASPFKDQCSKLLELGHSYYRALYALDFKTTGDAADQVNALTCDALREAALLFSTK